MNLLATMDLYGGGPGSGCNPAAGHCGRPLSDAKRKQMRKALRKITKRVGIPLHRMTDEQIQRAYKAHKGAEKVRQKIGQKARQVAKKARARIAKAHLKKIGKTTPGIVKTKGKEHIDVKPVWKGNVKTQYQSSQGHLVTELKTPKEYTKSGKSWIGKPSQYKGQFLKDSGGAFNQTTIGNAKEKNSFWIYQETPEKGVSVEIHRDLGSLKSSVIERTLGQYGAIIQHREVEFRNIGRASGFLNRRYGITFKLGGN